MTGRFALLIGMLLAGSAASAQTGAEERAVARWTSPTLTRFASEAEFRRYLEDLNVEYEPEAPPPPPPQPMPVPVMALPPPPPPPPTSSAPSNTVAVTGTRIATPNLTAVSPVTVVNSQSVTLAGAAANPAITNVQEIGVDEGDIVKQVGRFLLVLQDARIFSVDTRPAGRPGLALADRIDVYRKADDDAWYDEMLVYGDRVVVTGYSYDQEASQISVLRVDPATGRLSREGTFFLSSNDYYDTENYATRLVGDRLLIYTPYELQRGGRFSWPSLRRWRPGDQPLPGRPVFDARSIHRPIADLGEATIHTVSMCRLGRSAAARGLGCDSTAFVAPRNAELYVTPTAAYLWVSGDGGWDAPARRCERGQPPGPTEVDPAFIYRVALADGGLSVAGARGEPVDQMSLAEIRGNFHALSRWRLAGCSASEDQVLAFATIPLTRFGNQRSDAPASAYTPLPAIGTIALENRYTDSYLVYGGRPSWGSEPPERIAEPAPVVVVPVARPAEAQRLSVPHGILRVERVGSDIVLTGYADRTGLRFSLLDLDGVPRIASTLRLADRYESEGRSHAFNASVGPDGGLMGVPTVPKTGDAGRWWFRSGASDVSFVAVDGAGRLAPAGDLLRGDTSGNGYECEVSCIDWYGNSRPIFTDGRVFALTGSELVEGQMAGGEIRELRRLDIAATPRRR